MGVAGIVIFKYESKFQIKKLKKLGGGGGARANEFFLQRIQI